MEGFQSHGAEVELVHHRSALPIDRSLTEHIARRHVRSQEFRGLGALDAGKPRERVVERAHGCAHVPPLTEVSDFGFAFHEERVRRAVLHSLRTRHERDKTPAVFEGVVTADCVLPQGVATRFEDRLRLCGR
jgi:hypothetical protein